MASEQQWDIVSSVGLTALGVAAARAVASSRENPLIDDPYASALVRAASPPVPMPTSPDEAERSAAQWGWTDRLDEYLAVRTRYFDEFFAAAGFGQSVILASGLDSRAYRLTWARDAEVFEIDQPKVLEFKAQVLDEQGATPRCALHAVPVDLREDWAAALIDAGFDLTTPTAWLAEGLLPYLPPEAEQQLLETIDELSAPGSKVALEDFQRGVPLTDDHLLAKARGFLGVDMRELLHNDGRPEPAAVLDGLGWSVQTDTVDTVASGYGRELPDDFPTSGASRFVSAHKPAT